MYPQFGRIGYARLFDLGIGRRAVSMSVLVGRTELWGRGIGTATVMMLMTYARIAGKKYAYGIVNDENTRSRMLFSRFPHELYVHENEQMQEFRIILDKVDFDSIDLMRSVTS